MSFQGILKIDAMRVGSIFAKKKAPSTEPSSLIVEFPPWLAAESQSAPGGAPGGRWQEEVTATGKPEERQVVVPKVSVTVGEVPRSLSPGQ